jgi:hypothetical protein
MNEKDESLSRSVISDTIMFIIGMITGIVFNYIFHVIIQILNISKNRYFFFIGMFQILMNAFIIRYVRNNIENTGLFVLGLLSPQYLVIKQCYPKL